MMKYLILLIIALQILPLYVGMRYAPFPNTSIGIWYDALRKPKFSPPSILFPIVWTDLYILMGIAIFRIWSLPYIAPENMNILRWSGAAFVVQYVLTVLWPVLFFGWRKLWGAFVITIIIFILVILMTITFHSFDTISGFLLLPYWMWLAFASYLGYSIYQMNSMD